MSLVLLFTKCKYRWHSGWFLSPWCARSVCYRHLHIAAIWLWDEHQQPKHIPCLSNTNTIWPLVFISALTEFFWLFIDPSEIVSVGWEWSCMSSQSTPERSVGWHSSTGCVKVTEAEMWPCIFATIEQMPCGLCASGERPQPRTGRRTGEDS